MGAEKGILENIESMMEYVRKLEAEVKRLRKLLKEYEQRTANR